MLMMNLDSFESLSDANKKIVSDAANTIITEQFAAAKAEDQKWIDTAQANGMKYIEPSVEEQRHWVAQVRKEVWPQSKPNIGNELMQIIERNASTPETTDSY